LINGSKKLTTGEQAMGASETVLQVETGSLTSGTKLLTVLGSGNVGIGTTELVAKLDIKDTNQIVDSFGNLYIHTSDAQAIDKGGMIGFGGDGGGGVGYGTTFATISGRKENGASGHYEGYLQFGTSNSGATGSEKMRITSTGNVGIGTTNPLAKLDVGGGGAQTSAGVAVRSLAGGTSNSFEWGHANAAGYGSTIGYEYSSGAPYIAFQAEAGTNINTYKTRGFAGFVIKKDLNIPGLTFSTVATASADNQALTTLMTIKNDGNVGIGTTNPSTALEVNGTVKATAFSTVTSSIDGYSLDAADGSPTDALYVDNDGNVGIGTTNPSDKLQVVGAIRPGAGSFTAGVGKVYLSSSNGYGMVMTGNTDTISDLGLFAANGQILLMNPTGTNNTVLNPTSGNVGIGTTTPGTYFGVPSILDVSSASNHGFININGATGKISALGFSENGSQKWLIDSQNTYTTPNNRLSFLNSSATEVMTLTSGGNVGIGTTGPGTKLMVQDGAISIFHNNGSNGAGYSISGYTNGSGGAGAQQYIAGIFFLQQGAATQSGHIDFNTANGGVTTEKMRLWAAGGLSFGSTYVATDPGAGSMIIEGNVGIGTTEPGAKLEVAGVTKLTAAVQTDSAVLQISPDATGSGGIDIASTYNGAGGYGPLTFTLSGAEKMRITSSGHVGIGNTGPGNKLNVSASGAPTTNGALSGLFVTSYTDGSVADGIGIGDSGVAAYKWIQSYNGVLVLNPIDNNVGIGTTTPGSKLEVTGDVNYTAAGKEGQLRISGSTNNNYELMLGYDTTDNFGFITAAQYNTGWTNLALNPNGGNVGIGTTSPGTKLEVSSGGTIPVILTLSTRDGYNTTFENNYDAFNPFSIKSFTFPILTVESSAANTYLDSHDYGGTSGTGLRVGGSTVLFAKTGGNVGIGTTSPGGGTGSSVLTLANSSAAPTALANTTHLYSSAGEGYWMDAAGNATLQTPHDPVTGEWIFFSKNLKTGRVVKVDMEKLVREVERLSGKRFMMESFEQPHS
jgi:hypothetical protein